MDKKYTEDAVEFLLALSQGKNLTKQTEEEDVLRLVRLADDDATEEDVIRSEETPVDTLVRLAEGNK